MMYTTEREIRAQFVALNATVAYFEGLKDEIQNAFDETRSLCVIGCGSSYCIAKSAAKQFTQMSQIPAYAIPAGDLLANLLDYENFVSNSTLLVLSHSGSASEVLKAAALCKKIYQNKIVSICAREGSPLEALADVNLLLPWAFDESACQTRTVSNLYIAGHLIAAIVSGNDSVFESTRTLTADAERFCEDNEPVLEQIAMQNWAKAVVLADSAVEGLAEEGALAFKIICRKDSNYYHLLDVRHGPIVTIDRETLVIVWLTSGDFSLQRDLVTDLSRKTDRLLALSRSEQSLGLSNCTRIKLPDCGSDAASAVYALYCVQIISCLHAIRNGIDPDA